MTTALGWMGAGGAPRLSSEPKKKKVRAEAKGINWAKGFLREKRRSPRKGLRKRSNGYLKTTGREYKVTHIKAYVSLTLGLRLCPLVQRLHQFVTILSHGDLFAVLSA